MSYALLADVVVLLHLMFVLFVLMGGLLVLKWPWVVWLHVPAAIWGAVVEFSDWVCPLTPLENWLRALGGNVSYNSDFISQYLLPILYPRLMTRDLQLLLGTVVVLLNAAVYWWLWHRRVRGTSRN
jgi:Protein of Unknown function (DUF2784)